MPMNYPPSASPNSTASAKSLVIQVSGSHNVLPVISVAATRIVGTSMPSVFFTFLTFHASSGRN